MMWQPASAWTKACFIQNDAVAQKAVVTMACEGVKRHVAQDANLRHLFLDGANGAADKIVRIERLASRLVAQLWVGVRKECDAGNV